jgi:hypothetical protein
MLEPYGMSTIFLERGRMMIKRNEIRKHPLSRLVCLILLAISSSCAKPSAVELTLTSPYTQFVGTEYRVIADVYAYGIYEDLDNRKVISYVTLIPGVGIAGPEVAFKKRIAKGQIISILSAWRKRMLLDSYVYYVVALQDAEIPHDVQVRIDLIRGNEGEGAELNPRVYERIRK